jgi:tetratricopeptide (TPR) repeat protein
MSQVTRKRAIDLAEDTALPSSSVKRLRVEGTCGWIEEEPLFRQWRNGLAGASPVLWICGPPGCGKTYLGDFIARTMIDDGEQPPTAAYFCRESTTPAMILRSVLTDIGTGQKTPDAEQAALQDALDTWSTENTYSVDAAAAWDKFSLAIQNVSELAIILDGIDEIPSTSVTTNTFNFLEEVVELSSKHAHMKLCMVSRDKPYLQKALGQHPSIVVTPDKVKQDVGRFIHFLIDQNSNLAPHRTQIAEALLARAEGNFIWAKVAISALALEDSENVRTEMLTSIPATLPACYAYVITKQSAFLTPSEIALRDAVLRWTMTTVRLPSVVEVITGISADINALPLEFESRTASLCGPLLEVRDGWVHTMHHSVTDFFRDSEEGRPFISNINDRNAHASIAIACLRYLCHQGLFKSLNETAEIDPQTQRDYPLLQYASLYWVYHVHKSENQSEELMQLVRKFFTLPIAFFWADTLLSSLLHLSILPIPPRPPHAERFAYLFALKSQLTSGLSSDQRASLDSQTSDFLFLSYDNVLSEAIEQAGQISVQRLQRTLDFAELCSWLPGQRARSEALLEEASEIVTQLDLTNGSNIGDVALALSVHQAKADSLKRAGKYQEAHEQFMHLMKLIHEREDGITDSDSRSMFGLDGLGWTCMRLGQLDSAATYLTQALDLARKRYGSKSSMALRSKMTLAEVLSKVGRADDAETLCQDLIDQLRERKSNGVPLPKDSITHLNTLAGVFMTQQKYEDAAHTFGVVVEDRRKMFGVEHPMTLWATMHWGLAREAAEEEKEAVRMLFEELLPIQERVLGEHPDVKTSKAAIERLKS